MGDIDTDIGGDRPERCVFIGLPPEPQDRRLEDRNCSPPLRRVDSVWVMGIPRSLRI